MKKQKSLTKKIARLKTRLTKDAKKLAKLTMKLGASVAAHAVGKKKKKSAVKGGKAKAAAGKKGKHAAKAGAAVAKAQPQPKVKKKLNLTPERRAELSAAMKARWAAKRAGNSGNRETPPPSDGAQQQ